MGNHEYYGDLSGGNAASLWTLPDRLYYSVEYGDVYVAVINFAANLEDACQWLIQDAAKSDCTWKVLAVHQRVLHQSQRQQRGLQPLYPRRR